MTGPRVCEPEALVWFLTNDGTVTPTQNVLGLSLTLNRSWTPYGQGTLTLDLDEELAAAIDPAGPGSTHAGIDLLRNWAASGPDHLPSVSDPQQTSFSMSVRGVVKNYAARTMTVDVATFDQVDETTQTPVNVTYPVGTSIEFVITQVGRASIAPGSPPLTATLTEEAVWEPGVTAAAFIKTILGPTGRKILCDEQQRYWLVDDDTPITPTTPDAPRLYDLSDVLELDTSADLDAGRFADAVIAEYEWLDTAGTTRRRRDIAQPAGVVDPVWTIERPEGRYPGAGAAARLRARLAQWRHERTLQMLWDLEVRPGVVLAIDHGDNTITRGRVQSVTWREDGTMDVEAAYAEYDTGWIDLVITDPAWSVAGGNTPQARMLAGAVYLRGALSNSGFTGGYSTVATLPAAIPPPVQTVLGAIGGNTATARSVQVTTAGEIQMWSEAASAAWYWLTQASPYLPD